MSYKYKNTCPEGGGSRYFDLSWGWAFAPFLMSWGRSRKKIAAHPPEDNFWNSPKRRLSAVLNFLRTVFGHMAIIELEHRDHSSELLTF